MTTKTNLTALALAAAFATMSMLAGTASAMPTRACAASGRVACLLHVFKIPFPHAITRPVDSSGPHSPPPPPLGKPLKGRT